MDREVDLREDCADSGLELDYPRDKGDYGPVHVQLPGNGFGLLELQDGDEVELSIQWGGWRLGAFFGKRRVGFGAIYEVRNLSSGQDVKSQSGGSGLGIIEARMDRRST